MEKKPKPAPPSDVGRPPPADHETERVVLATVLLISAAMLAVQGILKVEHFYDRRHQLIYEAALRVLATKEPVDLNTVRAQLHATNTLEEAGGPEYLADLTRVEEVKEENIRAYATKILSAWKKRRLQEWLVISKAESFDAPNIDTFQAEKQRELAVMAHETSSGQLVHVSTSVEQSVSGAQQRGKGGNIAHVTPTGLPSLDRATAGGVHDEDLWVVAARPGVGKTSMSLGIARAASYRITDAVPIHIPRLTVAVFSLEMPRVQNIDRLICMDAGIHLEKWRTGELDLDTWEKAYEAADHIRESYLWIDDSPNTIHDIEAKVRALKSEVDKPATYAGCPVCNFPHLIHNALRDRWHCPTCHPNPFAAGVRLYETRTQLTREERVSLVIIDHLGKVKGNADAFSRANQVGEVTGYAKEMARAERLNCGVMLLVQLNRELEKREGKSRAPRLTDLAESGNIEQDADVVIFPHRRAYQSGEGSPNEAELIIAKQRNGKVYVGKEAIQVRYVPECSRFDDLESFTRSDSPTSPAQIYTGDFPAGL